MRRSNEDRVLYCKAVARTVSSCVGDQSKPLLNLWRSLKSSSQGLELVATRWQLTNILVVGSSGFQALPESSHDCVLHEAFARSE